MQTVSNDAFTSGRALALHPVNSQFVVLYDGYTTVVAYRGSKPVKIGAWYSTYYELGQIYLGAEVPLRV